MKGSTIALSSLVGPDALVQTFNDIDLGTTSAQQLWDQVCRMPSFIRYSTDQP